MSDTAPALDTPSETAQQRHHRILAEVREAWRGRANDLGYKGKKRDSAVMDFLAGVRVGLLALDPNPERRTSVDALMFFTSVRGSKSLERDE